MLTYETVRGCVKALPFRPFRLHGASGRTFDVRRPEVIKVLKNHLLIFEGGGGDVLPDEAESVSLMLPESISPLETPAH